MRSVPAYVTPEDFHLRKGYSCTNKLCRWRVWVSLPIEDEQDSPATARLIQLGLNRLSETNALGGRLKDLVNALDRLAEEA